MFDALNSVLTTIFKASAFETILLSGKLFGHYHPYPGPGIIDARLYCFGNIHAPVGIHHTQSHKKTCICQLTNTGSLYIGLLVYRLVNTSATRLIAIIYWSE